MRSSAANRRVLVNSLHHLPPNSVAIRKTNLNKWIELTVGVRRLKQLPDLSALEAKRPDERQYMTRDQLRTEYGSDPAAIEKIEKFAGDHQLVVTRDERASARLGIAGTVANVSHAFGVKLLDYGHPKLGDFHARTGTVTLPAEVARAITGVFGLNNHRVMHRLPRSRQKVDALASFSKTRPWFIPTELAGIYNFPNADARSQCIGLLEFGGGVDAPASFINLAKGFIDKLNADHSRGAVAADFITRQTFGISFYDSMVAFEKGDVWRKEAPQTGHNPLLAEALANLGALLPK